MFGESERYLGGPLTAEFVQARLDLGALTKHPGSDKLYQIEARGSLFTVTEDLLQYDISCLINPQFAIKRPWEHCPAVSSSLKVIISAYPPCLKREHLSL